MGVRGAQSSVAMVAVMTIAVFVAVVGISAQAGLKPSNRFQAASAGVTPANAAQTDAAQTGAEPEVPFVSVAAGLWHACGLRADGTVVCSGDNEHGQSDAPVGEFTAIAAGHYHTCGIRVDATLACWGKAPLSPTGEFTAVEAGGDRSCALRVDGAMVCWSGERSRNAAGALESESGGNVPGLGVGMQGPFEVVAVHDYDRCGVRSDDDTIECFNSYYKPAPSGVRFKMISIGADAGWDSEYDDTTYVCGVLLSDSTVNCWGEGFEPQAGMTGHFDTVVVGGYHACGLRTDGAVSCWWTNPQKHAIIRALAEADPEFMEVLDREWKMADAPGGQFSDLDASWYLSCGVRTDGAIVCWGRNDSVYEQFNHVQAPTSTPDAQPADPTTDDDHAQAPTSTSGAGIVRDLEVDRDDDYTYIHTSMPGAQPADHDSGDPCSGWKRTSPIYPTDSGDPCSGQTLTPPQGEFTAIAAGAWQTCAIRTDRTIACWGINPYEDYGQARSPQGEFTAIAAGAWHSCAIRTDDTAMCWGRDPYERMQPPGILAGYYYSCSIRTDDTITCQNHNADEVRVRPAVIEFSAITAGGLHSCGIRTDDTVKCWGTEDGDAPEEDGEFTAIAAGAWHSCAIRTDRTVTCWADDSDYENYRRVTDTPGGEFTAIAVGGAHACAIRLNRATTCWGSDALGQMQVPEGKFTAIAAGAWHTCALRADRTAVCWGDDQYRQSQVPEGEFTAITAGAWHTCAIRTDRTITCWGATTLADRRAPPQHMGQTVEPVVASDSDGR